MQFIPRYTRIVVSYTAAAVSAGYCSMLGHFHIDAFDPQTWSNALSHRCGRVMLLFAAWAALEMLIALVMPRERDSTPQLLHAR